MDKSEKQGIWHCIAAWCYGRRRLVRQGLIFSAAVAMVLYGICVFLSYQAAYIFNRVANERQLFPGSITIGRISATPMGKVSFEHLVWKGEDGDVLADIPQGSFQVRVWDVLRFRIHTTTVTSVDIEKGYLHLVFNDRMELQNVNKTENDRQRGDKKGMVHITGLTGDKKFNCRVRFHDGKIEAEAPKRHFIINNVNLETDIHTGGRTTLHLLAGHFDGTVAAEELRLNGNIDFAAEIPQYDLMLVIKDCNPKSLGVGINIKDKASVQADIKGDLPHPVIDGELFMEKLAIPALYFTHLTGSFHYEDGKLAARDVTAAVFGGRVEASGNFDLDEKSYEADLKGTDLMGGVAARDLLFRCRAELDLHMSEDKTKHTKAIYGTFSSGPGRYHILPFKRIAGSFSQTGRTLAFKDVVISLDVGDVTTDAFSIIDGKLHLGKIYLGQEKIR